MSFSFLPLNLLPWLGSTHQNHAIVSLWPAASCWCWYYILIGRGLSGRFWAVPYLAIEEATPVALAWRWMYTEESGEKEGANGWAAHSDIHWCPPPVTMWSIYFSLKCFEQCFLMQCTILRTCLWFLWGQYVNCGDLKIISSEFQVTCKPRYCLVLFED